MSSGTKKWRRGLCVAALVVIGAAAPRPGACEDNAGDGLRAGAARLDITPKKPVQMAGYASRKELSKGVHDPLSTRVLAFQSGRRKLVLVATDVIGFYSGTAAIFRKAIIHRYGLAPSELFLSAIHTHSGPAVTLQEKRDHPNNVEYTQGLKEALLRAVGEALRNMQPVRLGAGSGASSVGRNRRRLVRDSLGNPTIRLGSNPGGVHDQEVQVLKIETVSGGLLAVAFDYATHSTALGPRNLLISGDVHGLAEQFVERFLGKGVIAPAFAGASGNIDPCFRVLPGFQTANGWIPEPVLLGTLLGEEVVHTMRAVQADVARGSIGSAFETLALPGKPEGEETATKKAPAVPLNLTVARVGDVALVGLGAEVFTEVGLDIKKASPFGHTLVITHCNGTAGYLPAARAYLEGGYEVRSSPFASTAAGIVVKRAVELLHDIRAGGPRRVGVKK